LSSRDQAAAQGQRKRHKTRHPGIYYRERPDGARVYIIWYRGTDGKDRFENVAGGERDAVRARSRIIDRKARGEKVAPTNLKLEDWAYQWLGEREIKPNTYATRLNAIKTHIVPKLGQRRVCDLNVNHVAWFITELHKNGKKASTINVALTTLSGMMKTAVRRGLANANPVSQLERHERPKGDATKMEILDSDEIGKFLASAPKTYYVLLATAVFTGLRISELLSLRWEDVDWDAGVLHVKDAKTKAGVREVVLMDSLQQILAKHSLESTNGLVFHTRTGKQINRSTLARNSLKPALEKAGITKHIRFHDLRHTFASILIDQKHPETYIAEQMGHSSSDVTRRIYGHLIDRAEKRREARAKMEEAFGEMLGENRASDGQAKKRFGVVRTPGSPPV
jgi:integrase